MIKILLLACLTCPSYTTPVEKYEWKEKVQDTLEQEYKFKQEHPEPRNIDPEPIRYPDHRIDFENFKIFNTMGSREK